MKMMRKSVLAMLLCLLVNPAVAADLKKGDAAPEFVATSTQGVIRLGDLLKKGPVILAFYLADFTPV